MRSILLFVCLILSAIFVACSGDEESKLIGDWELNSFIANCPDQGFDNFTVSATDGCANVSGSSICLYVTFNEDGTAIGRSQVDNDDEESGTFSWTLSGDNLSLCPDDGDPCADIIFDGNSMEIIEPDPDCEIRQVLTKG